METVKGNLNDIYCDCYTFAKQILILPQEKPNLYTEVCPSEMFPTIEYNAVSQYKENRIIINASWAEDAIISNLTELEFYIFHELRHFHQYEEIAHLLKNNSPLLDEEKVILQWEYELNPLHYKFKTPDPKSIIAHDSQLCERDANAFGVVACNLLNIMKPTKYEFRLPPFTMGDVIEFSERPEIIKMRKVLNSKNPNTYGNCPCGSGTKYKWCTCKYFHPWDGAGKH